MFIDAWVGLVTAVNGATFTEFARSDYGRQPISFGKAAYGVAKNSTPYQFTRGLPPMAGLALFNAPTGGTCLFTYAFPAIVAYGSLGEGGDAGTLCFTFTDLLNDPTGGVGTFGPYSEGQAIGTGYEDPRDYAGMSPALSPSGATLPPPFRTFNTGPLTAVTPLLISRGVLQLQGTGEA
jgi:hypothetical protein